MDNESKFYLVVLVVILISAGIFAIDKLKPEQDAASTETPTTDPLATEPPVAEEPAVNEVKNISCGASGYAFSTAAEAWCEGDAVTFSLNGINYYQRLYAPSLRVIQAEPAQLLIMGYAYYKETRTIPFDTLCSIEDSGDALMGNMPFLLTVNPTHDKTYHAKCTYGGEFTIESTLSIAVALP